MKKMESKEERKNVALTDWKNIYKDLSLEYYKKLDNVRIDFQRAIEYINEEYEKKCREIDDEK